MKVDDKPNAASTLPVTGTTRPTSRYFSKPPRPERGLVRFSKRNAGLKATTAAIALTASILAPSGNGLAPMSSSPGSSSGSKRTTSSAAVTPESTKAPNKSRKSNSPKKKKNSSVPRTESFGAIWAGNFPDLEPVEPHTLILGTHPSIKSLEEKQYYGHPMNAFWWIAGDFLGFRRNTAISPSTGKPYAFSCNLRHSPAEILPYPQQIRRMATRGFCMWDIIQSCEREGSLDQNIQAEVPNDIRGFCEQHTSIRRIVLANGGTGSTLFVKHFRDWFEKTGELVAADHVQSQKAFNHAIAKGNKATHLIARDPTCRTITLISAVSVSPAAARYSYQEKRDFWEEYVYRPGLADAEGGVSIHNANH